MRKRFSIETIQERRLEAQGRGQSYRPFLRVQDFPSKGETSRLIGETTGRRHELLSRKERACFLIFDYDSTIIDIREQFPLFELSETIQISEMLGYKPPREPESQYPVIMTTDFVLTQIINGKYVEKARAVKTREDFNEERTRQKLEIERIYWQRRGIDWKIILEESINWNLVENLEKLRKLKKADEQTLQQMYQLKQMILMKPEQNIAEVIDCFERNNNLRNGRGLFVLKHLIKERELEWDLNEIFNLKESYR